MIEIYLVIFAVWVLSSFREIPGISYFWQLKEYRIDRMRDFLSTGKGRALIFSWSNLFRVAFVGVLIAYWIADLDELVWGGVIALGLVSLLFLVLAFKKKKFYRPKKTFRMLVILELIFVIEFIGLFFFRDYPSAVLVLEIFRPLLVSFIILLVGIPFIFAKKYVIRKASKKMRSLKNLKVIGITGSYGKTSTKEFLYDILKNEFNVLRTPKNINVDIGVARTVLKDVDDETEIFIVEMGAYKRREIDNICKIVGPDIGILTGINEQHMSLFGNIKNTIRAKAELLARLPKKGLAIVNGDNDYCHEALEYCRAEKTVKYGISGDRDVKATGVKQNGKILRFKVHINDESENFEVGVLGKHYVQNLLAVIYCAFELGLSLKEIAQYVKSCKAVEQSLELFEGKKGVRILDDSYNSNPDGFIAALKTAKDLNAKRVILVTMGMLELGKESKALHRKVAKEIKKICDVVFVTSKDAYKVFKEEIDDIHLIEDHKDLINRMDEVVKKGDLILFENRVQKAVLDHFKK